MPDTPKAFAVDAPEGVDVHIDDTSEAETFDVKVIKEGAEIESHEGITIEALAAVNSDHFSIELVEPPAAPEPAEDEDE